MTQNFKLYPIDPTTDCKLVIAKDRPGSTPVQLTIQNWKRILPNKTSIPIDNRQGIAYQCTALDNNCCIEVTVTVKNGDKVSTHVLNSNVVTLNKQLKQRSLYIMESMQCRISIDEFSIFMMVSVQDKKVQFKTETGKFEVQVTQSLVEIEPFSCFAKINFTSFRNDFLRFYCDSLKWTPKFRSSFCYCIFNSKLEQDLFLVAISDCFKQVSKNTSQIKIIGTGNSQTPRNQEEKSKETDKPSTRERNKDKNRNRQDKELKNDGSTSSIASNNKSKQKNKEKVKISERLNLKKSYTKLANKQNHTANEQNPNQNQTLINGSKNTTTTNECLNIFQEDDPQGYLEQTSTMKQSDLSMDLRSSFEQFEQKSGSTSGHVAQNTQNAGNTIIHNKIIITNEVVRKGEDDSTSNHSFKQKNAKGNGVSSNSLQEENMKLKQQNMRLQKQLQQLSQHSKQASSIKKKYLNAVQQLTRLENERSALVIDKVKFQTAYHQEVQQKQKVKQQLEMARQALAQQRVYWSNNTPKGH